MYYSSGTCIFLWIVHLAIKERSLYQPGRRFSESVNG